TTSENSPWPARTRPGADLVRIQPRPAGSGRLRLFVVEWWLRAMSFSAEQRPEGRCLMVDDATVARQQMARLSLRLTFSELQARCNRCRKGRSCGGPRVHPS